MSLARLFVSLLLLLATSMHGECLEVFTLRLDGATTVAQSLNDEGALAAQAMALKGFACTSLQGPKCSLISGIPESAPVPTMLLAEMLRQVLAHTVRASAHTDTATGAGHSVAREHTERRDGTQQDAPVVQRGSSSSSSEDEPEEAHREVHVITDDAGSAEVTDRLRLLLEVLLKERAAAAGASGVTAGSDESGGAAAAEDDDLYTLDLAGVEHTLSAAELRVFMERVNAQAHHPSEELHLELFEDEGMPDEEEDGGEGEETTIEALQRRLQALFAHEIEQEEDKERRKP